MSFTAVGDAGVASIAHALHTNSTLQTLRLNSTNAAEEAAIALTAACQVNTALTELEIAGNPFNDVGGIRLLEIFTASHPSLRVLSLSGCGISDVSARLIAEYIVFCQSLTELDLSFNRVCKEYISLIARIDDIIYCKIVHIPVYQSTDLFFYNC